MTSPIDSGVRHEAARGLQVIWLAFLGSIFFYTLILMLIAQQSEATLDDGVVGIVRSLFWVLATVLAIMSFVWRTQVADLRRPRHDPASTAFTRLRVACLVTWSFCEAVALLGVVLGSLTYRVADYAPLISLGAALLFVHRPAAWPIERYLLEDFRR